MSERIEKFAQIIHLHNFKLNQNTSVIRYRFNRIIKIMHLVVTYHFQGFGVVYIFWNPTVDGCLQNELGRENVQTYWFPKGKNFFYFLFFLIRSNCQSIFIYKIYTVRFLCIHNIRGVHVPSTRLFFLWYKLRIFKIFLGVRKKKHKNNYRAVRSKSEFTKIKKTALNWDFFV